MCFNVFISDAKQLIEIGNQEKLHGSGITRASLPGSRSGRPLRNAGTSWIKVVCRGSSPNVRRRFFPFPSSSRKADSFTFGTLGRNFSPSPLHPTARARSATVRKEGESSAEIAYEVDFPEAEGTGEVFGIDRYVAQTTLSSGLTIRGRRRLKMESRTGAINAKRSGGIETIAGNISPFNRWKHTQEMKRNTGAKIRQPGNHRHHHQASR